MLNLRPALFAGIFFLAACGASSSGSASAQNDEPLTAEQEEFDRQLREALMRNPEFILRALEAYRAELENEAAQARLDTVDEVLPELVSASSGHAIGASAEDAELIIVEFFDYHCGFCRQALDDVMERAESSENVRVVFQEFPILREESRDAALAALAAAEVDEATYAKVHRALMESSGLLDEAGIDKALKRAGVKAGRVEDALSSNEAAIQAKLDSSVDLARRLDVGGTPFFVIHNPKTGATEVLEGYRPESLENVIAAVR